MERDDQSRLDLLLDWHLDRLDEEERSKVENALRDDPELRAMSDQLGAVLRPLDSWTVSPAATNLADKALARIERETAVKEAVVPFEASRTRRTRWPFFLSRDLIAAAACIALLIGVFVPGFSVVREKSRRAICSNNLGSIYQGMTTYQASFAGALPYAGGTADASWLPECGSDKPFASNSRHLYLLVQGDYGPKTKQFVCPSCPDAKPMDPKGRKECCDFPEAGNVSYAAMNMAGPKPNLRPKPTLAYLSDANPLFREGHFDPTVDPYQTNSPAHKGMGQTVLIVDGSVRWTTTPVNPETGDNLWLIGNIREYKGTEVPVNDNDTHLVPGFPGSAAH